MSNRKTKSTTPDVRENISSSLQAKGIMKHAKKILTSTGKELGSIFLLPHPWAGLLLWSVFLLNIKFGLFALLGLVAGTFVERILQRHDMPKIGGGLKANAILAAVATAWLTSGTLLSLPMILLMSFCISCAAALLAAALERSLNKSILPPLIAAYCIITAMLFGLFPEWTIWAASKMSPWPEPTDAIGFGSTFLRSLGSLLFTPQAAAGIIVGIAILLWSRAMFLCGIVGWLGGVGLALIFQNLGLQYYWPPVSYNFFVAGMALGAAFFLPGRSGLLMALLGGVTASFIAIFLQHILHGTSSSYLPIPIILTIWLALGILSRPNGKSLLPRNTITTKPPENAWWHITHWQYRFGYDEPLLMVPVAGPLQITQGFNGSLSHVGLWRHALDFQRPESATGQDSSIWTAPVLSPASGTVDRMLNLVPDNPLGVSNFAENWGNYIVTRLNDAEWVMLAHLRQGSIKVAKGAHVDTGDFVAEAGNSGRSPIPHLHLQVQSTPEPGAPTVPFRLANFLFAEQPNDPLMHWKASGVPNEGEIVMASTPNPAVHSLVAGIAPGTAMWTVETQGQVPQTFVPRHRDTNTIRIRIRLDEAGRYLFCTDQDDILVSTLAPDAWRLTDSRSVSAPFLKLLGLAAPSIPYAACKNMTWDDAAFLSPNSIWEQLTLWLAPYLPGHPFPLVECTCKAEPMPSKSNELVIETTIKGTHPHLPEKLTCTFEPLKGPTKIQADFKNGSITYELLSFEPTLPLEQD